MKEIIKEITKELERKFMLETTIEGNVIKISEFDGYAKDYNTYRRMEELAIRICDSIRESKGDDIFDVDYEIIGQDGEFDIRFEVIL